MLTCKSAVVQELFFEGWCSSTWNQLHDSSHALDLHFCIFTVSHYYMSSHAEKVCIHAHVHTYCRPLPQTWATNLPAGIYMHTYMYAHILQAAWSSVTHVPAVMLQHKDPDLRDLYMCESFWSEDEHERWMLLFVIAYTTSMRFFRVSWSFSPEFFFCLKQIFL
jgi:hypothetical protein